MTNEEIPVKCLGETGALSFKKPTEQEMKETQELECALSNLGIFETAMGMSQRREALMRLQELANIWIRSKAVEQNLPPHMVEKIFSKMFTFGSYRLGVNFQGADVDAILAVPRFITREEFFTEFQELLCQDCNVEEIYAVVDAYVPVLKMKFMTVEIDLLFAQIDQMSIPDRFNLCGHTEVIMRNMDERDVRSINGVRVTEEILDLVYNKSNFKVALKVIRIWAKRRNVYSNALGFLGGVSWAILVARICQLYPYASASMLVHLFFKIFSQWPWPKPVRLRESECFPSLCLSVWDPRQNPSDQYHLMPILTPSYPCQNSTYNVQRSSRIIIERELKHGLSVVEDIVMRKLSWSSLFDAAFFFEYRHYVVVIVAGSVKSSFSELCGLVESRLRVLVSNLELNRHVKMAHINCRCYGKGPSDKEDIEFVRKWFIGMEFDRNPYSATNLVKKPASANGAKTASDKPILNVDLSDNIISFEKSIERGMANGDVSNTVTVKYVKKSGIAKLVSAEEMVEIKQQAVAAASGCTKSNVNSSKLGANNDGKAFTMSSVSPASSVNPTDSPGAISRSSSSSSMPSPSLHSSEMSECSVASPPPSPPTSITCLHRDTQAKCDLAPAGGKRVIPAQIPSEEAEEPVKRRRLSDKNTQ